MISTLRLMPVLMLILTSGGALAQNASEKTIDLRYQVQPRIEELIDATQFSAIEGDSLPVPETSLAITVKSIGPVSEDGTAVAEVAFQNVGKSAYRFPLSLEMKLLHTPANVDRRSVLCAVQLSDRSGPLKTVAAFSTYTSVSDNSSWVELRPRETLVLRFDPKFGILFGDSADWKDRIRNASVEAGIVCYQKVLHDIPGKESERKYSSRTTTLQSTNRVIVSMAP